MGVHNSPGRRVVVTLVEVKRMAKELGVVPGRKRKGILIREIQEREGNIPCFATPRAEVCGEEECLWREDCLRCYRRKLV